MDNKKSARLPFPAVVRNQQKNNGLARITFDNTGMSVQNSELQNMLREYNRTIIDKGQAMSRGQLRKLNTIDTRNLIPPPENKSENPVQKISDEEKLFLVQNYWYCFIPCFETGVLHINAGRYIYWDIKKIDMDDNRVDIFLQDYIWQENSGWQIGVSGVITWSFEDPIYDTPPEQINHRLRMKYAVVKADGYQTPYESYSSIYQMLDYEKDLNWDKNQIALWKRIIIRHADTIHEQTILLTSRSALENLASLFTGYILKVNKALYDSKIQKSTPAKTNVQSPAPSLYKTDDEKPSSQEKPQKQRRIRTIGLLEITSREIPRASSRKTLAHWKTASWTKRGHIRTYKNGTKVYIPPITAYRKALKSDKSEPIPTTIQFKKKDGTHDQSGSD